MIASLSQYIEGLFQTIPFYIYVGLVSLFCLGVIFFIVFYGARKVAKLTSILFMLEYLSLLFFSTVLFRPINDNSRYNFQPFWSYSKLINGECSLPSPDLVMNLMILIPIGALLGFAFKKMRWWKVFLIGGCISLLIECMQLLYKKGFSELDDVMHNTMGCMIGYGIYILSIKGYKNIFKKSLAVYQ